MDKFIKILKKKTKEDLPSGFDQRFWTKIDRPKVFNWQWLSLPIATMLVVTIVFFNVSKKENLFVMEDQIIEMLEDDVFFKNMDLVAELSEEDWMELLDEA